ncbi:condensin complex subunit 2-like isoform X2 [Kryptolebias marmoratus]|uniref:condensin complex subunit 2-like isoform X2 n=1 Tax=Kryptolebias marmoratus TaxID=37003 RepID=UPI0007F8F686|nr:condensin complex subunit 2-like isoform X2 [Kryptolebias marmoratus]
MDGWMAGWLDGWMDGWADGQTDGWLSQEGQKRLSGELGEGIGDYDYNNANDTVNFCPGLQVEKTAETPEVSGEKVFSQTTKTLLQRLPNTMAQNLSVPLAFVALLHLANEKNLELVKVDDMSDIIIRQGR